MSLEQFGQFKKNPAIFYKGQKSDGNMCKFSISCVGAKKQWKKKLFNGNQRGMKEQHQSLPEYDRKRMAIGMMDFEI